MTTKKVVKVVSFGLSPIGEKYPQTKEKPKILTIFLVKTISVAKKWTESELFTVGNLQNLKLRTFKMCQIHKIISWYKSF